MRTRFDFIQRRVAQLQAQGPGTPVELRWVEWATAPERDLTTGAAVVTEENPPLPKQAVVNAFVHFVNIGTSGVKVYNEVDSGDAIVDFAADVELEGKEGLRFFIEGEEWVPKAISDRLAKSWDVLVRGRKLFRPVLLRRAT